MRFYGEIKTKLAVANTLLMLKTNAAVVIIVHVNLSSVCARGLGALISGNLSALFNAH